jgi:hypothetical protein
VTLLLRRTQRATRAISVYSERSQLNIGISAATNTTGSVTLTIGYLDNGLFTLTFQDKIVSKR